MESKIGTTVSLGHINLYFPKRIVLKNLFLEDQQQDTLLYAEKISVNTDLWALTGKSIELNEVALENFKSKITRSKDSVFNFDYIVNAFASQDTVQEDTTSSSWDFSLGDIDLKDIRLHFIDKLKKNEVKLGLGKLTVDTKEFDLKNNLIRIDDIAMSDVSAMVSLNGEDKVASDSPMDTTAGSTPFDISFNSIELNNINANYSNEQSGQEASLKLGDAVIDAQNIDLGNKKIDLQKVALSHTFISYIQLDNAANSADPVAVSKKAKTESGTMPWQITLSELSFANNSVQYYDYSKKETPEGLDFNRLWLSDINLDINGVIVKKNNWKAQLQNLAFHEQHGFDLENAHADIDVSAHRATISDFLLETGHSKIQITMTSNFDSVQELARHYADATIDAKISDSFIAWDDVRLLAPDLLDSVPLEVPAQAIIAINASVEGAVGDLTIHSFNVDLLDQTALRLSGSVRGLPDIDRTYFQITLNKFYATRNDINSVVTDSLLPESIALPQWINLIGQFSGTINTPQVQSSITSSLGSIEIKAALDRTPSQPTYNGSVAIHGFDVGQLLKNPQAMGRLDMVASVDGSGFDMEHLDTRLKATVQRFVYQHYAYEDLVINGNVKQYVFDGKASMNDPNLNFELAGDLNYNYKEGKKKYHFTFDLKNADLKALHLAERPLKARFAIDVDLDNADPKNLNGSLDIRHVAVYNGEKLYKIDSLLFASVHDSTQTKLTIQSDIVEGEFTGSFDLPTLPEVMTQYFHTYYQLHDTLRYEGMKPQHFKFHLDLKNTAMITDIFVPELKRFSPQEIKGEFNSEKKDLSVTVKIGEIQYASFGAENIDVEVSSNRRELNYMLQARNIAASSVNVPAIELKGTVAEDSIRTNLTVYDSLEEEKYSLAGIFGSTQNAYRFHFIPDEVMLNYHSWSVPPDNYIQFGPSGLLAHNMRLSKGQEEIAFEAGADRDSTMTITFTQLDLRSLTSIASARDTLIGGTVQGAIKLYRARSRGALEATVDVYDLTMKEKTLGNIHLFVNQKRPEEYEVKLGIEGSGNDVFFDGNYVTNASGSQVNIKADIKSLSLASIQPLLFGQAKEMEGRMTGALTIGGSLDQPRVRGSLTFKEASFIPTYINSKLILNNETIAIDDSGIVFNNFEILDEKNNTIHIDGNIETSTFRRANFNLEVSANNFLILNTDKDDSDLFYGKVRVTTDARISGSSEQPRVDMEVSLGDGSEFTYVVPQPESGYLERKGIVEFVDKDAASDPFLAAVEKENKVIADTLTTLKGIVLNANVELDDKETFNIVIDPATGDKLTVRGNTTLTLSIDPTGDMDLTGRYELTEGTYSFTFYKLLKRDFDIEKGSTITWSGDPLNAALDITAVYDVETSPIDLLSNQLTGTSQQEMNRYKQRLTFLVYLNINGNLLTPDITFSLGMPERERNAFGGNVYARLQDINSRESDLNKQVFALLILKRFISENPLQSEGGGTLESTARRSVSRLLTEQLNRLAENVKGVELSFDVKSYEDYSSGEAENRTQLQLGVSKSLLNDRLVVKLAGNVNVEGNQGSQSSFADYIGDLALEYKLTEDGRFRITGFRNSDYNMIDGELKETGLGLIYVKDYNTLRELFLANDNTADEE